MEKWKNRKNSALLFLEFRKDKSRTNVFIFFLILTRKGSEKGPLKEVKTWLKTLGTKNGETYGVPRGVPA